MKGWILLLMMAVLVWPTVAVSATDAASAATSTTTVTDRSADARQQLDQILQQPIYQAWKQRQEGRLPRVDLHVSHGLKSWIGAPFRWLSDFIKWLFRSGGSSGARLGGISEMLPMVLKVAGWTVLGIAVIFFGVLIAKTYGQPRMLDATAQVLSRRQVHEALEAGDALALGTAQWMEEARRLAMEQNFRAVYRALYLALLSGLHRAGKIEHNPNRTNWTYVQHYRGPAEERSTFAELTELFDRVWYGRLSGEGGDLEQLRGKVMTLTGTGIKP